MSEATWSINITQSINQSIDPRQTDISTRNCESLTLKSTNFMAWLFYSEIQFWGMKEHRTWKDALRKNPSVLSSFRDGKDAQRIVKLLSDFSLILSSMNSCWIHMATWIFRLPQNIYSFARINIDPIWSNIFNELAGIFKQFAQKFF